MKLGHRLLVAAAAMSLIATPALASNGGGGGAGGAPSSMPSGKQIDPAKRYAEGVQLLQAKDYKKAQKAFDDVLDVAGKDPNTNFMMSLSLIGQDNAKDARKYLRNVVKYDAKHVQGRGWLGAVEAKLGDAGKANEQKTALVDMKTACAGACPDAAKIDAAIAQIDAAIAAPTAPLVLSGEMVQFASAKDGDAAYFAASALINEGRYQDALYSLHNAALALGPHADVLTYQGFANRKLHNYDVAVGFYSAALKLNPEHRGANEYLGEYFVETHQMAKAKAQLVKLEKICTFGCEQAEELRRWIAGEKS
ncbi:MAG TPA: tetratricopeptide repeat protein [Hyphomonadaceae bacterium]|nr:tetratricopeptide repeat protein [Hyphomonadaceae bacterium]